MTSRNHSRLFSIFAAALAVILTGTFAPVAGAVSGESKITATDAAADDNFGLSVSISGDTAVIGSPFNDDAGSNSGSAYVFVRSGTTWTHQAKLTASDAASFDNFGRSVAVSGDTAVIGSAGDDDAGSNSGAAYVFVRSGTTWTQQTKLTASDAARFENFGYSVAVSGDTAVIGSVFDEIAGSVSGSAYVFTRSGASWTEQAKLTASDAASLDHFGYSVSVSGDTAVIGSVFDEIAGSVSGSAYVFTRSGTSWSQQAKLTASDAFDQDAFGSSVSVSLDTVVIGSPHHDAGGNSSGSTYVFTRSGGTWTQQTKLTASDAAANDQFGSSVSSAGDLAVIGSFGDDDDGSRSGSAYAFARSGGTWTQKTKLTASDAAAGDQFGFSVSVSGETSVIGSPFIDDAGSESGSAYVLELVPPDTFMTFTPPRVSASSGATFEFLGTDNRTPSGSLTFRCSLDGALPTTCSSPVNYAGLADGSHTFSVSATDDVGNPDPTPASYEWDVDTAGPETSLTTTDGTVLVNLPGIALPAQGSASDTISAVVSVDVTFTALSPGATDTTVSAALKCDPTGRSCTWTADAPPATGQYKVTAQSTDALGNQGPVAGPINVTVVGSGLP